MGESSWSYSFGACSPALLKLYEHCGIITDRLQPRYTLRSPSGHIDFESLLFLKMGLFPHFGFWDQTLLMTDYTRFLLSCHYYFDNNTIIDFAQIPIHQHLQDYSSIFANTFLLPLLAHEQQCSIDIVDSWQFVVGQLTQKCTVFNAQVSAIIPTDKGVNLELEDGSTIGFDECVVGVGPNAISHLVQDQELVDCLKDLKTEKTMVALHTDYSQIKYNKDLSFTISMEQNQCQSSAVYPIQETVLVKTVNPIHEPRSLERRFLEIPIMDTQSLLMIDQLDRLQGKRKIHVVGSFAYPGIASHEAALCSAMKVSYSIGYACPFFFSDMTNRATLYGPDAKRVTGRIVDNFFVKRNLDHGFMFLLQE
ncbi:hypothetical protein EDD86DRAFT_248102 [Gorgonomyces haynaldii]|nr:hypothetical protein EDD86DRAFT_248102 [Gorgonomyces haynaldii]